MIKMVLKLETFKNLRTMYYTGIFLMVAYVFPLTNNFVSRIFDFEIKRGVPLISIVALLVGAGAVMAYNRKL